MERLGDWVTRRYLDPTSLRVFSCAAIGFAVVLLGVSFATAEGGRTAFGTEIGADYAAFYSAGLILNGRHPGELYDLGLQDRLQRQFLPGRPVEESLPYVHPPFVALVFSPLARLPYSWSYLAWLVIAAGLYVAGLLAIRAELKHFPYHRFTTAFLLAVSFQPFLMDAWLGGQLSVFGFLFVALALRAESQGRPVLAGVAYGLCLYKPTLLVLIVPMLVVGCRWRTLLGLAGCGLALAVASLAVVGVEACEAFGRLMTGYVSASTGGQAVFRLWKFVDLNSFTKMLLGSLGPAVATTAFLTAAAGFVPFLVRAWWYTDRTDQSSRRLVTAATVGLTPVLNLHVGNYDTVLVVPAVLLTLDVLYGLRSGPTDQLPSGYKWLLVLLWVTPWLSQVIARESGFQPFTLVLAAVGLYPLILARRAVAGPSGSSPTPAPPDAI